MIKRFIEVDGRMLFPIAGQQRIAYTLSGSTDFYELKEREKHGGHPGTVIKFYDYRRRRVVQPFEQKPNVMYSAPIFSWNHYFFLQCDYGEKVLEHTPELLPVLAEAGVVDSGGQGLIEILKGVLKGLKGETVEDASGSPVRLARGAGMLDDNILKMRLEVAHDLGGEGNFWHENDD